MAATQTLASARELADTNKAHFPNESAEYRAARNGLLIEEIELRRQLEHVAAHRRALPPGGEIPQDFEFASETGPVRLSHLFGTSRRHLTGLQHDVWPATQITVSLVHIVRHFVERDRDQSA